MAEVSLGQQLDAAGWDQGVLVPALPQLVWMVHFHLDRPITKIARGAKSAAEKAYNDSNPLESDIRRGFGYGMLKATDRWVIATQGCDIVSNPNDEPVVLAFRAFITTNPVVLASAATNSSRYFLLDEQRSLIADAAISVLIEKPLLAALEPQPGASDDLTRERFARWIAHRFTRPALPDSVVAAVVKPILENLRQMQQDEDPEIATLDTFHELRIARLQGEPPYNARILFVMPENEINDGGKALARLIKRMREWLDPRVARITAWDARDLFHISVGDYIRTDKLYLDHYTYKGRTVRGLTPPPPI